MAVDADAAQPAAQDHTGDGVAVLMESQASQRLGLEMFGGHAQPFTSLVAIVPANAAKRSA